MGKSEYKAYGDPRCWPGHFRPKKNFGTLFGRGKALKVEDVSNRLGVSKGLVYGWVRGENYMLNDHLIEASLEFGVSIPWLLDLDENEKGVDLPQSFAEDRHTIIKTMCMELNPVVPDISYENCRYAFTEVDKFNEECRAFFRSHPEYESFGKEGALEFPDAVFAEKVHSNLVSYTEYTDEYHGGTATLEVYSEDLVSVAEELNRKYPGDYRDIVHLNLLLLDKLHELDPSKAFSTLSEALIVVRR